jgi:hypothetical protein
MVCPIKGDFLNNVGTSAGESLNSAVEVAFAREFGQFERTHISGKGSASFAATLRQSLAVDSSTFTLLRVEDGVVEENPHLLAWCLVDDEVTLCQVRDLVGEDTLYLDDFGRGGGGAPETWLIDVVISGAAWEAQSLGRRPPLINWNNVSIASTGAKPRIG